MAVTPIRSAALGLFAGLVMASAAQAGPNIPEPGTLALLLAAALGAAGASRKRAG